MSCLPFDLQHLIIPLVSSNLSFYIPDNQDMFVILYICEVKTPDNQDMFVILYICEVKTPDSQDMFVILYICEVKTSDCVHFSH